MKNLDSNSVALIEGLTPFINSNVTIFKLNSFGFPTSTKCRIISVIQKKYAQYDSAVWITFIPKGKRKPYSIVFEGNSSDILIYKGFVDLNADMYTSKLGEMKVSELGFSSNYKRNAISSTVETPIVNVYKKY